MERYQGTYEMAGRRIHIDSLYERVHLRAREFAAKPDKDMEDISIRAYTDQKDIEFERERTPEKGAFADAYLEELAVYRQIAEQMPYFETMLLHGSAFSHNGAGYIFMAKSGTGKSTHARLLREFLGDTVVMINDDKPLLRIFPKEARLYGTPWNGKHHLGANISAPLRAICFLERDKKNHIAPLDKSAGKLRLLQHIYRPLQASAMARTMQLADALCNLVDFYELRCNQQMEAAKVSYEGMMLRT